MFKVLSCPKLSSDIIRVGICAMPKKINRSYMKEIIKHLKKFSEFEIKIFDENIIFKKEVEEWPIVDALFIFFTDGFPYSKGLKYIELRKPFLINDFEMQSVFWDRKKVIQLLKEDNIPAPNNIIIDRGEVINNDIDNESKDLNSSFEKEKIVESFKDEIVKLSKNQNKLNSYEENLSTYTSDSKTEQTTIDDSISKDLLEFDDHIEFKGQKLYKPFVEKPFNGDDHCIYIYYPPSHGGGHKRLFRKTKELSSLYFPNLNEIRKDKSYIYEEFLQTDGFDIKVYTVGPEYAHAEARKSPTLDGKVNRSSEGKEIRYPINLTQKEKEIARKIVLKFKQNICEFDILRHNGNSYVCDVNGWPFVKNNKKYYEDCAKLMRKIILKGLNKGGKKHTSSGKLIDLNMEYNSEKEKIIEESSEKENVNLQEELRSIVAVFRHADRSPKQKMKFVVEDELILSLFDMFGKNKKIKKGEKLPEIKLKKPKELIEVLKIVNTILQKNSKNLTNKKDKNFFAKIFQIKMVLERKMHFDGLTRKIQMKPLEYIEIENTEKNSKKYKVTKALMILKWGGSLTHSGIEQGIKLGKSFRLNLYPVSHDSDSGLTRLHSTYRHDLKCYSSDEGRCLKTAASFLKGLLELEGPIIPIISSMVKTDENVNKLLDVSSDQIPEFRGIIKQHISDCLNYDGDIKTKFHELFLNEYIYNKEQKNNEKDVENLNELLEKIGNPFQRMKRILTLMKNVIDYIRELVYNDTVGQDFSTYFITNRSQICDRDSNSCISLKNYANKILGEDIIINDRENYNDKEIKTVELGFKNIKNNNVIKNKSKKASTTNIKITDEQQSENNYFDCQDENIILIYKRYVKLKNDFYSSQKDKFDVSKIPDIYDNIKYDIIHNRSLIGDSANELYNEISLLAYFVMPFEYGITCDEKINIGLKIIKPLLNKVCNDLVWWDNSINNESKTDENWSGLDTTSINENEIRNSWRHVRSRFYFTCSSHMYALFNLIGYGSNSSLIKNKKKFEEFKKIFDLDYISHIIFRLFEDFNVSLDDSKRYRLEIMISPGCNKNPIEENNEQHLIDVADWIVLNENLSLKQLQMFLKQFEEKTE